MKKFFFLLSYLLIHNTIYCNEIIHKDSIKVGIYIDNIYDVNYIDSSYKTIFYIWFVSNNELKTEQLNNDISNFLDIDRVIDYKSLLTETNKVVEKGKVKYYYLNKINATILNKMDVSKFPFDVQNLNLYIELNTHYKGDNVLILDKKNSIIRPNFIDKWKIGKVLFTKDSKEWDSNFGDVKNEVYQLDALNIKIPLERASWTIYWKLFIVLFISFFLTSLSVFLPNKQSEEKLALIVGSLFTAIGNKYITESYLPISDTFNLSDTLHLITFIFIAFFTTYAIYEQRACLTDNFKKDYFVFFLAIVVYFLIISITTLSFVFN